MSFFIAETETFQKRIGRPELERLYPKIRD